MNQSNSNLRATVLVVEDDPSVRKAMVRLLRVSGYRVTAFESADALLAQAEIPRDGCIISDIRMPGTGGTELPVLLSRRGLKVPVILVTAYDSDESRAEAKRVGAAGYFRKPIDEYALLDTIKWVLHDVD